jgi:prevent-host-death family protein
LTNTLVRASVESMGPVSVYDAKTHLSRLLDAVEAGEEVVITRNGHPVARLVRALPTPRRRFGTMPGVATVRADFDEPLSIDALDFVSR